MKVFVGSFLSALVVLTTAAPGERGVSQACTHKGARYGHGTTFKLPDTNHCFLYKCNNGEFSLVKAGCQDSEGNCHDVGQIWKTGPCIRYKCVREMRKGDHYSKKLESAACAGPGGTCHSVGTTWKHRCLLLNCTPEIRNDGSKYLKTRVQSAECMGTDGACHALDSTWKEQCVTYHCISEVRNGHTYMKHGIRSAECKDVDGKCHGENEVFSLDNKDSAFQNCKCQINRNTVKYHCNND